MGRVGRDDGPPNPQLGATDSSPSCDLPIRWPLAGSLLVRLHPPFAFAMGSGGHRSRGKPTVDTGAGPPDDTLSIDLVLDRNEAELCFLACETSVSRDKNDGRLADGHEKHGGQTNSNTMGDSYFSFLRPSHHKSSESYMHKSN